MFAAGMIPRGVGPGTLERARHGLLNYLVQHLSADEVRQTVIVFDAKDAPPEAVAEQEYRGLRVLFARDHDEADDLIEQLIHYESVPATTDCRHQRLASEDGRPAASGAIDQERRLARRNRTAIRGLRSSQPQRVAPESSGLRQLSTLDDAEVAAWLEEFGLDRDTPPGLGASELPTTKTPCASAAFGYGESTAADRFPRRRRPEPNDQERAGYDNGGWGPFPPGYGEDLLADGDEA